MRLCILLHWICAKAKENMSFLHHCTLLVLFSFFCIKLAPAQEFSPPSLPSCTQFLHPNSPFPVNNGNATLNLFDYSLILSSSLPPFSTNNQEYPDLSAHLAFILVRSRPPQPNHPASPISIQSIELDFDVGAHCIPDMEASFFSDKLLNVCNPLPQHSIPVHSNCSCKEPDPNYSGKTQLNVSLTYDEADAKSLQVQVNYTGRYEINQTFTLDFQADDSIGKDDIITLFIGYIITIDEGPTMRVPIHGNNSKSNKIKIVLWVVVGVSIMIFLMGLIILVLSIAKRRGRPSLVSSRPGGRVAPSSTTSRDPFPLHRLESGATPMMLALPPSPPYNNDFHLTGIASWVKQPNPR